jgi:hypothetical protein
LALMGSPEDHAMDDMLERSKIFNYVNIFGSLGILTFLGISVGIAFHIGQDNDAQLRKGYQIIIAMLGGMCVTSMIPYFIYDARRPGQKVPDNTSMLMAGPKYVSTSPSSPCTCTDRQTSMAWTQEYRGSQTSNHLPRRFFHPQRCPRSSGKRTWYPPE